MLIRHVVVVQGPPATLTDHLERSCFTVAAAKMQNTVFKLGRTSGPTTGVYHGCTAVTCIYRATEKVMTSLECVVLPPINEEAPFAAGGDSGALVYGPEGQAVGMIWGGVTRRVEDEAGVVRFKPTTLEINRAVFVTPLDAIIRHVEAKCESELGKGNFRLSLLG